jgi:hypothetical protein
VGRAGGRDQLEEALKTASDDLYKAANQFAGLLPDGRNQHIFVAKAERAVGVLAGEPQLGRDRQSAEGEPALPDPSKPKN